MTAKDPNQRKGYLFQNQHLPGGFSLFREDHQVINPAGQRMAPMVGERHGKWSAGRHVWESLFLHQPKGHREYFHRHLGGTRIGRRHHIDRAPGGGVGVDRDLRVVRRGGSERAR